MKYLQNFVLLTIIYQTQCQTQSVHDYIAESKVEGPLFVLPVENPIFTLENSQDNFKVVFQPGKEMVPLREFSPPHPPPYQMAFGPPGFLDQRQIDSTKSAVLIDTGLVATPREEKSERLFGSFGTKISANHKRVSKRDSPPGDNAEVPETPALHFSVLPSIDSKNDFSSLVPLMIGGIAERSFNTMGSESPLELGALPSVQAFFPGPGQVPSSDDLLPPQLASLLPREENHSTAWNASPKDEIDF